MSNISITSLCNRSCRYCFAGGSGQKEGPSPVHMSMDTFTQALDYLERSNIDQVRLLGGEPTLHPQFPAIVSRSIDRGFKILLFSNGLMSKSNLLHLSNIPAERLSLLLNVTDVEELEDRTLQDLFYVMERLGPRITMGINLYSTAIPIDDLLELIDTFHLQPCIHLGLAHPNQWATNRYLHPKHYHLVGEWLSYLSPKIAQKNVTMEFDCGFVPCMFPGGDTSPFGKNAEDIGTRCNPILDIMPDGHVISCYPLAGLDRILLMPEMDASGLRARFEENISIFRNTGIYSDCSSCSFREMGKCMGGCMAAILQRLHNDPFTIEVPDHRRPLRHDTIISQDDEFKFQIMGYPMNYYVYENWTAENKAVIHRADCGFCKDGKGCHNNILGKKNGQWNGPYQYFDDAINAAKATGRPVKIHRCI